MYNQKLYFISILQVVFHDGFSRSSSPLSFAGCRMILKGTRPMETIIALFEIAASFTSKDKDSILRGPCKNAAEVQTEVLAFKWQSIK